MNSIKPSRGVYILGNDNVIEDSIAFMNSLRQVEPSIPVMLIPYNDQHQKISRMLKRRYGVGKFSDQNLLVDLDEYGKRIRHKPSPAYRKMACWSGPFDEFVFLDLDIVIFEGFYDIFNLLTDCDIVYCGSGRSLGIKNVFTEQVWASGWFSESDVKYLFNSGFFASRKGILSRKKLYLLLEEATGIPDIFFPELQDQPILNFIVLKAMPNRCNLRETNMKVMQDAWAGGDLEIANGRAYRNLSGVRTAVRHLHWAGFKVIQKRPYVGLWLHYRYPGIKGLLVRVMLKIMWQLKSFSSRILGTGSRDWYKPKFQILRFRRIIKDKVLFRESSQ